MIEVNDYAMSIIKDGYNEDHKHFTDSIKVYPIKLQNFIDELLKPLDDDEQDIFFLALESLVEYESINYATIDEHVDDVISLDNYLVNHPEHPDVCTAVYQVGNDSYEYETYWNESQEKIIWNRQIIKSTDILLTICLFIPVVDKLFFIHKNMIDDKCHIPLFKYHPERYVKTRLFFKKQMAYLRDNIDIGMGVFNSIDTINDCMLALTTEMNTKNFNTPLKHRVNENTGSLVIDNEISILQNLSFFHVCGKQILDIDENLIKMFKKTNVDDIPLSCVQLPFASQYLYFGKQDDIELAGGWFLDGAYVEKFSNDNALRITITATSNEMEDTESWYLNPEPIYHQRIPNANSNIDIITAITTVFSKQINDLKTCKMSQDTKDTMKALNIKNVNRTNNLARIENKEKLFIAFQEAIKLIANAACYLSTYSEDNKACWPINAPKSLTKKANSNNMKESTRATSKLNNLGYTKIRFFGNNFDHSKKIVESNVNCKATHWRRGHWRNQSFGPKGILRKLKWIMPMLINNSSDNTNIDINGHIYMAK